MLQEEQSWSVREELQIDIKKNQQKKFYIFVETVETLRDLRNADTYENEW